MSDVVSSFNQLGKIGLNLKESALKLGSEANPATEQVRKALQPSSSSYFDPNLKEGAETKKIDLPNPSVPAVSPENISRASASIINELRDSLITKVGGEFSGRVVGAVLSNLSEQEKTALNDCINNRAQGKFPTDTDKAIMATIKERAAEVLKGAIESLTPEQANALQKEQTEFNLRKVMYDQAKKQGIDIEEPQSGPLQTAVEHKIKELAARGFVNARE